MITTFYSGILGILFFMISIETIKNRRKHKISLGFGPNDEIAGIVSAHSNFSSYACYFLFLLFLAENSQVIPIVILHILGLTFTVGRFIHFYAFKSKHMKFKFRVLSMHFTLWTMLAIAIINIFVFVSKAMRDVL
jgi:uncharacterized membrane protein YecN with MAPEG domain